MEGVFEVGVVGPDDLFFEEFGGVGGGDKIVATLDVEGERVGAADEAAVEEGEAELPDKIDWEE